MPQSKAFESVSKRASTFRAAIRRQASLMVVVSGTVKAFERRNRFTVRSPTAPLFRIVNVMKQGGRGIRSR